MATRILLWFLVTAGLEETVRDYNGGHSLGEIMIGPFVFIAIGVTGLWNMRKDKDHQDKTESEGKGEGQ